MQTNWTRYFLTTALLSLAGCQGENLPEGNEQDLGTQTATAESDCIETFKGIRSCAVGDARLDKVSGGFDVTSLKDSRTDGVASHFDGAVSWSQEGAFEALEAVTMEALADGKVISSLTATYSPSVKAQGVRAAAGGQASVLVRFDSPTAGFWMNLYDGLGISYTLYSPLHIPIGIRNGTGGWYPGFGQWGRGGAFGGRVSAMAEKGPEVGACVWSLDSGKEPFIVVVDGKEYRATRVEFVEDVSGGSYPYNGFSGINVKAQAESYKVRGERITTNRK